MFVTLNVEVKKYQKELALKQYEATINTDKLEEVTSKLTDLESAYGKNNLKNNSAYQDLVAYQLMYNTKKDSLETEMEFLESALSSFKTARNNNIKSDLSFWCLS